MARHTVDQPITTKNARQGLEPRREPYWRELDSGAAVGYRKGQSAGFWIARVRLDGAYRQGSLGQADDHIAADGEKILDYRQAEKRARVWAADQHRIEAGGPDTATRGPYTVAMAMEDYVTDYAGRGGKSQGETRNTIAAHILPELGAMPVERLGRERIKKWHRGIATSPARLRSRPGGKVNLRPIGTDPESRRRRQATANRVLTVLKAALNHVRAEGKVRCSDDAWAAVKAFREADKAKIRYLMDDEINRLVNACPSDLRALVIGALQTGCRYGELAAMTVGDFDPTAGTVAVMRSKSGKGRHVVLATEGRTFFAQQAAGRPASAPMFERSTMVKQATRSAEAQFVLGRWGKAHQSRPLEEACKAARIDPVISFHILRHTYASRLARSGAPMAVIASQLGHSGNRMTERHYAHMAPSYVADTVRRLFGDMGIVAGSSVISLRNAG